MTSYRERVLEMEAPSPSPTGGAADVYFHGWYMGAGAAAQIAAEADAQIAELEAAMRRVAWFLREADPHWVRVDTDDGPEIATLLGLATILEAALTATDAIGTGREGVIECQHARSDMTPCWQKDGDMCLADDGACVGCGLTPEEAMGGA